MVFPTGSRKSMHRYRSQQTYCREDGPWPVKYSTEEIQQQRAAGKQALLDFQQALAAGSSKFELRPGVYRIERAFEAVGVTGLDIRAPYVELIVEGSEWSAHFRILSCKGTKIGGPLVLDAWPFGMSQGVILNSTLEIGKASYLEVQLDEGYPFPVKGHRITCFQPRSGLMIARYQDVVQEVVDLGNSVVRLTFDQNFYQHYKSETQKAVQTGNLICLENTENMRGGFELRDTTGIELNDISMHTFGLTWGLPMDGDITIKRFQGCRRPNTNRLMGGGFLALSLFGGRVHIEDCELGHNFDDLTDIGSELGFAFKQVAPNQVYVGISGLLDKGKELVFYNAYTLERTGKAAVVDVTPNEDPTITHEFWAELKKAAVLTWDTVPSLVTLDREVRISRLEILDCTQARPESLTIVNSYLHDSLAAGISLKGAKQVHIQGNVIERAGYRACGVGFDPYWWEGGVPANITIVDNCIIDSPFNLPDLTPAINIYIDAAPVMLAKATGTPIHNVHIANNTIVNAKTAAIGVAYTKNALVTNNIIHNPMAAGLQTAWGRVQNYDHPCAIFLDTVENAAVTNNRIAVSDPQLIPQVICVTNRTDRDQVHLENNTVASTGRSPELLPTSFFQKVSCCDNSRVQLQGVWQFKESPSCFSGRVVESCSPKASATFKWQGTRGRVYGTLGQSCGEADIYVDGSFAYMANLAVLPRGFAAEMQAASLHDQLIFDSGCLQKGDHELVVVVRRRMAPDLSQRIALEAFDYLA